MPEVVEQPETRREALASALEAAAPTPPAADTDPDLSAAAPAQQAAGDAGGAATPEKSADHSKDGKFAKGNAAAAKKPNGAAGAPVVETPAQRKAREYPGTWKKEHEPTYRKLEANPEFAAVLDEIERRETDMKKGFEGNKALADYAQTFQRTIQPFEQTLRQLNMRPEVAVQSLLAADHALRYGTPATRVQNALKLLQGYGIDPAALTQEQVQVDPNVQHLQNELSQVKQQNQTLFSSFQQQMLTQAQAELAEFSKDKPLMKLDEVRNEMKRLIDKGISETVPDAYERAIYGLPAIREKVIAEQRDKAETERRQKAQAEAAAAKTAAVQVKGAPSGNAQSASSKAKDRRSQLAEAASRLS